MSKKHTLAIYPRPDGNSYETHYGGQLAGVFTLPLLDGARWLLNAGKAAKEDTVEVYCQGLLRLRANVGRAAQLTVKSTNSGIRFVKWVDRKQKETEDDYSDCRD